MPFLHCSIQSDNIETNFGDFGASGEDRTPKRFILSKPGMPSSRHAGENGGARAGPRTPKLGFLKTEGMPLPFTRA